MHDDDGNRIGEIHDQEAEWDEAERATMLAYAALMEDTCAGCGQPLSESTDPANAGDPDSLAHYVVPPPRRCHSCTAVHEAFGAYRESPHPQALRFHSELIDRTGGGHG